MAGKLAREGQLHNPAALDRLVARLNGLKPTSGRGAITCPADDGSAIRMQVEYPNRPTHRLEVALSGCRSVRAIDPPGRGFPLTPIVERYLRALTKP
jgi:hypothetical protein